MLNNKLFLSVVFMALFSCSLCGQSGKVGIGVPNPKAKLHVDNDVLFEGIYAPSNPESIPIEGQGSRLMWYPSMGAFRAGFVTGTQWDSINIGNASIALGYRPIASGNTSVSLGLGTTASGNSSVSLGSNSTAFGFSSTASGLNSSALGDYSLAIGNNTLASGFSAVALGQLSQATGTHSVSLGSNNISSSIYAMTWGAVNKASGFASTASGFHTVSNGYTGTVIGVFNDSIVSPQSTVSSSSPLFIIGNGDGENTRSNAMVVRKDGKVGLGTSSPEQLLEISGPGETALRLTSESSNNPKLEFIGPSNWSIENVGGFIFYKNILDPNPVNEFNFLENSFYPKQGETSTLGTSFSRWKEGLFADFIDITKLGVSGRFQSGASSILLGSTSTHNLDLITNNQSRMTIDDVGQIGIGTENPNQDLTIFDVDGLGNAALNIKDNTREVWLGINANDASLRTITNHKLSFWTHNSRRMTIDNAGNIGIGLSGPDTKLHVTGDDNDGTSATLKVTSGTQSMLFDGNEIDATSSDLFLQNNTNNDVVLANGGGNVGIGTSSPEFPLHIENPGTTGQTISMVIESDISKRPVLLFSEASSDHSLSNGMSIEYDGSGSGSGNKLRFNKTDGNSALTIENGGDVGINTDSPQVSLHIAQNALTNADYIRLDNTADLKYWDIQLNTSNELQFRFTETLKARIRATDGSYMALSDRRLKENISKIDPVLSKIDNLNPVTYRFKDQPKAQKSNGFIAQEVEELFPEIVSETDDFKALNYDAFGVIAIQAIKEQQVMIEEIQQENFLLKKKIEELKFIKAEMELLKKQIKNLQMHQNQDSRAKIINN
ncbi:MAG: hypothetical protein HKN68_05820 [Saprospiraceae bacterium]|nr:hypothetical protein [Saprospiraceae bacterium]